MTKKEDGIPWPMGIGFGVYFWFIFQPGVIDFVFELPWIIGYILAGFGGLIAFAGSIVFPLFLYETVRRIGFSEDITWAILVLGGLVLYATAGNF